MSVVGTVVNDALICLAVVLFVWGVNGLVRAGLLHKPIRRPRPHLALFGLCLFAIYLGQDFGAIRPRWIGTVLGAGLGLAYGISGLGNDDDDDHRPRRRLRSALKRARSWLASGIPARRVTV